MHPGQRTIVKHLAAALSPQERLIVILRHFEGLPIADVAELAHATPADVWKTLDTVRHLARTGLWLWARC